MTRFLTKIIIQLLSKLDDKENPKADMHLPLMNLIVGIFLIPFSIGLILFSIKDNVMIIAYLLGIPFLIAGICLIIAYCNEKITILSEDEFERTNFFGKKRIYRFSEIQNMLITNDRSGLLEGAYAITIIFLDKRIKIDESAILSERFRNILLTKYKELNNEIL